MKKFLFALLLLGFATAAPTASAHMGDITEANVQPGFMMMEQLEDRALGDELHEEMEGLMIKMMSGTMTEEETGRMVMLMEESPGAHATMMGRMMGMGLGPIGMMNGSGMGFGMMNALGAAGGFGFVGWITIILLWIFLALGTAAFWKTLQKN